MGDLSSELIFGRDWCDAIGVIIYFAKQKIHMIIKKQKGERCGITVVKGVMEFKNSKANLVVANLTSQV